MSRTNRPTAAQQARLRRLIDAEARRRSDPAIAAQDEKNRALRRALATRRMLQEMMLDAIRAGEPVSRETRQQLSEQRFTRQNATKKRMKSIK